MMARTFIHGQTGVDAKDFHDVAKALRLAKDELAKDLQHDLRAAGEIVAAEARRISSEHSTSIPPTVKTRVRGATVEVRAGSPEVPIAKLFEVGNKGSKQRDTFRHPVFGKDVWVNQKRYPFMAPAVELTAIPATAAVLKTLDKMQTTIVEKYRGDK